MSRLELAVLFVDGLDHDFIMRNHPGSGLEATFPAEQIHRVEGVLHSIECMNQIFAGRREPIFEVAGRDQLPALQRLINWDLLLPRVDARRLIWQRLNRRGWRVGLFEMLGVFISPSLDGFSLTKHTGRLGLSQIFRWGLCHHPAHLGRRFEALKQRRGYPIQLRQQVEDYRTRLRKPLREHDDAELLTLMQECGYLELPALATQCFDRLLALLRDVLDQEPVEALFLHTGYFDLLLHLFWGIEAHEPEVMAVLQGFLDGIREVLGAQELLVFSDHGMAPAIPHEAEGVIHRTDHRRAAAVVMGSGPRVSAWLAAEPPRDLTAVYRCALEVAGVTNDAAMQAVEQEAAPQRCRDCQLEGVIAEREQVLRALDRVLADVEHERDLLIEQQRGRLAEAHHQIEQHLQQGRELQRQRARDPARGGGMFSRPLGALATRLSDLGL